MKNTLGGQFYFFRRATHSSHIGLVARPFKSVRRRHSYFPKDTRHFPIREWVCLVADFSARRILSCVLQEQNTPILRGNLGIVGYYL